MTIDDETLMAYADGELDAISAKRVERAIAAEPALADAVAAHRALRTRLDAAFGPIAAEPVPERLTAMVTSNVIPLRLREPAPQWRWRHVAAIAASVIVGVGIGQLGPAGPISEANGRLVASGSLAKALTGQLASAAGDTRVLLSFRDRGGTYCRVFAAKVAEGIACRETEGWTVRRMAAPGAEGSSAYRQAGSDNAGLLAEAQDMMAGAPLTEDEERAVQVKGWK